MPFHEWFDVDRWDQPNIVPKLGQLARPMMGPTACFHRDHAGWLRCKEIEQLAAAQLATEHHTTALIGAVRVKSILRDIQPD
jgi:hypothetical protein